MSKHIDRDEVALLAYYAWERDGRPDGKDLQYWVEAEKQIVATKPLLIGKAEDTHQHGAKKWRQTQSLRNKPLH